MSFFCSPCVVHVCTGPPRPVCSLFDKILRHIVFVRWCMHAYYKARSNLVPHVKEQDAESSGQSPRYACWARDFRLWISKEKRNLETAVRICSGLLYSFLNFYQSSFFLAYSAFSLYGCSQFG